MSDDELGFDPIDAECAREVCVRGELDESPFTTKETLHHVTLALALAAGTGAVVLFFVEGGSAEADSKPAAATQVMLGLGAVGVRGAF